MIIFQVFYLNTIQTYVSVEQVLFEKMLKYSNWKQ